MSSPIYRPFDKMICNVMEVNINTIKSRYERNRRTESWAEGNLTFISEKAGALTVQWSASGNQNGNPFEFEVDFNLTEAMLQPVICPQGCDPVLSNDDVTEEFLNCLLSQSCATEAVLSALPKNKKELATY